MNSFLEAALRYAGIGWHVFPIWPGEKEPRTAHGVKDATTDAQKIRGWWTKWPDANVAVACGKISGIYVVDVDVSESANGYDSLQKQTKILPVTVFQHTPRGGCHAFYRTDDPPANRNGIIPGVDIRSNGYYVLLAPSVRSDGRKYEWAEGHEPWNMQLAKYPDFLRPTKTSTKAPATTFVPEASPIWRDQLAVAKRYLAGIEPAVQGQAGGTKLLWACGCMTWGCNLPFDQAYNILASEYNPRCIPPWDLSDQKDERGFRRKIAESIRIPLGKPRGWILSDPAYAQEPLSEVRGDVAAMVAERFREPVHVTVARDQVEILNSRDDPATGLLKPHGLEYWLKDDAKKEAADEMRFLTQPTGLAGEICSWINATSFKPQPYLTLACVLAFLGVLFGRKVKDALGSRTNLYCMGVAKSSAGKNHAMKKIRELCMAASCVELLGGSSIASDTAIESRVAKEPATLFLLDEIGHLLTHIKSGVSQHQSQVISLLMQLYSAASDIFLGREYADDENQRTIVQPCLCIYGVSTPDKFAEGLSQSELDDGWLSRCLVFYEPSEPRKRRGVDLSMSPPTHMVDLVSTWAQRRIDSSAEETVSKYVVGSAGKFREPPPGQILVPTEPAAEQRFIKFDDMAECKAKKDPKLSKIWAKGEENARRVALVLACSDSFDSPIIIVANADRACRMIEKIIRDFSKHVAPAIFDNKMEEQKQQIVNIVDKYGAAGCQKREITRATRWATGRLRNDILADLTEGGDIICRAFGRIVRYWTSEHCPPEYRECMDE